ncbi:bifunctional 4-hydroxy-2-oxoglutarate aldolase/2-dehydro-3-deoxy-phosphogluconate aldolase [Glutamicibacter halophytocola]|uniref:bifunctional 4-hydroxy-2-oxoglutarate aldolase/2-dehydro-3-deoxy-phosphogluconate aldolase n=1 Tax=Glutamicibacter halophytocola TaxID=1933880 RepID=UPI00321ABA0A
MTLNLNQLLEADRTLAVVRAESISDASQLAAALGRGGIRTLELTFTTPNVLEHIRRVADTSNEHGVMVGVGTVLTAAQAEAALDAGAQFLVTPGLRPEVARVAGERNVPFSLGALTPSEVAQAVDLGSEIVKIFPARHVGPGYLKDLLGPFPELKLLPSGGINEKNGRRVPGGGGPGSVLRHFRCSADPRGRGRLGPDHRPRQDVYFITHLIPG